MILKLLLAGIAFACLAGSASAQTVNCRRMMDGNMQCDNGTYIRQLPGGGMKSSDGTVTRPLQGGGFQIDSSGSRRDAEPGRLCIRDIYGRCAN